MLNRSRSLTTVVSVLGVLTLSYAHAQTKWQDDAPGKVAPHRRRGAAGAVCDGIGAPVPALTPKPESAKLQLPPGFKIDAFTRDIEGPRVMRIAPNGDIFVRRRRRAT